MTDREVQKYCGMVKENIERYSLKTMQEESRSSHTQFCMSSGALFHASCIAWDMKMDSELDLSKEARHQLGQLEAWLQNEQNILNNWHGSETEESYADYRKRRESKQDD